MRRGLTPRAAYGTLLLCAAALLLCAMPAAVGADVFGPISLASASAVPGDSQDQQADYAHDAVISGNGGYVAFDGSFGGKTGVFRRDLVTGEVATVAEGDAVLPSISESGQYVSFTTTARLDEENDTNSAPDVYVRDMGKPSSKPCPEHWEETEQSREECAFELVSAVNGSARALTYEYESALGTEVREKEEAERGSVAAGRSALGENSHGELEVAFVTSAVSNLANPKRPQQPTGPEPPGTPALQVAVRDLDTKETKLVSVLRNPATGGPQVNEAGQSQPVPTVGGGGAPLYGAVYTGGSLSSFPSPWEGASISANGEAVTWMGQQIGEQAPVLSPDDLANQSEYTEPLWRRIGEGPQAPTRRVTGGSDPESPPCAASGETQLTLPPTLSDPCQGPFDAGGGSGGVGEGIWTGGASEDYLPRLSAEGWTIAFISNAREIAQGEEFRTGESSSDLYVVDMHNGLTRVQALRRLTELAGGTFSDPARVAPIVDFGLSPDGSQVAFTTERTVFPLSSPAFVSAPAARVGMVELYDADLADETLTRVTQGYEGQPSEASTGTAGLTDSPSFSAGGDLLAFSSEADNLVYGDGNKGSDAFVVERLRFPSIPTPQEISSGPPSPSLNPPWELGVTALSQRDGSVLVEVEVPGAGTLSAGAHSAVRVRSAAAARGSKVRDSKRRGRERTTVATRTVATKAAHASAGGLVTLTLKLSRSYSALAGARGGLSATIDLAFDAPGHRLLREDVAVTFARAPAPAKHARRGTRHSVAERGHKR